MQNAKKTAIVHSCRLQQTDSWWQCSLFHSKFFSFSFSSFLPLFPFLSFSFSLSLSLFLFLSLSYIFFHHLRKYIHTVTHTLNSCNILKISIYINIYICAYLIWLICSHYQHTSSKANNAADTNTHTQKQPYGEEGEVIGK